MLLEDELTPDREGSSYHSNSDPDDESSTPMDDMLPPPLRQLGPGLSGNTGPKGVLADYREACTQLRSERLEKNARIARLMQKTAVGDAIEYVPAPPPADKIKSNDRHPEDIEIDEELEAIRARRLQELRTLMPEYGQLVTIETKQFIDFVEKHDKRSFVVISLFKADVESCLRLNLCLGAIAPKFSRVRFCKMAISQALPHYDNIGLPALVVYQGGQQIQSFVPLWKYIGTQFSDDDIVQLLCQHEVLSENVLTIDSA